PEQRLEGWRTGLARLGLHAMVEFDTVAPALDGEEQLYDKLALLMDTHAGLLQRVKRELQEQRQLRRQDAMRLLAQLLVAAAAYRVRCAPDDAAVEQVTRAFRHTIRQRESVCVAALLKRYNFNSRDFPAHALPLEGERWGMDLFHPAALKDMGIHLSKGMAA